MGPQINSKHILVAAHMIGDHIDIYLICLYINTLGTAFHPTAFYSAIQDTFPALEMF